MWFGSVGRSAQLEQRTLIARGALLGRDSLVPGRLLVGFTPAGRTEHFFRDLAKRAICCERHARGKRESPARVWNCQGRTAPETLMQAEL